MAIKYWAMAGMLFSPLISTITAMPSGTIVNYVSKGVHSAGDHGEFELYSTNSSSDVKEELKAFQHYNTMPLTMPVERGMPEWKGCVYHNATSAFGDIYGGCHNKHSPKDYMDETSPDVYTRTVKDLLFLIFSKGPIENNPRSVCVQAQSDPLCVSWANEIKDPIPGKQLLKAADYANKCMYDLEYSTEVALWTFTGERVFICISDRPNGCSVRICTGPGK